MAAAARLVVALGACLCIGPAGASRASAMGRASALMTTETYASAATMLPGASNVEVVLVMMLNGADVDHVRERENGLQEAISALLDPKMGVVEESLEVDDVMDLDSAGKVVRKWFKEQVDSVAGEEKAMEPPGPGYVQRNLREAKRRSQADSCVAFVRINLKDGTYSDELEKQLTSMVDDGRLEAKLSLVHLRSVPSFFVPPMIVKYDPSTGEEIVREKISEAQDKLEQIQAETEAQEEQEEADMVENAAESAKRADEELAAESEDNA